MPARTQASWKQIEGEGDERPVFQGNKRRLKLVLKTKLSGKNKIIAVNTWAVATLRYSTGVIDWTVEEL